MASLQATGKRSRLKEEASRLEEPLEEVDVQVAGMIVSELLGDLVNQWQCVISKTKSPTSTPRIGQLTQPDPHMLHFISEELLLLLVNKTHYDSSFIPLKPMESDGTLCITNMYYF